MTSQGRSPESAACLFFAAASMLAALITAIVAISGTAHVSDKLEPTIEQGYYQVAPDYEPFDPSKDDACAYGSESEPPDQEFWTCQEKESGAWSAQVAARQADAEAKGDLAIIFGLFGLTFMIGAVALNTGRRPATRSSDPTGYAPEPDEDTDPVPAQSRPTPDE
jgi:hypothetical protein